jgi:hypothetical protein
VTCALCKSELRPDGSCTFVRCADYRRPCALCAASESDATRDEPTPYCAACEADFTRGLQGMGHL